MAGNEASTGRQGLLQFLLRVPPSADPAVAERGRFVAALTLVAMPLLVVTVLTVPRLVDPHDPTATVTFWVVLAMNVAALVAYLLNRTGHYLAAAVVFTTASVGTWVASTESPELTSFLVLTTLIAIALLPARVAGLVGLGAVVVAVPNALTAAGGNPKSAYLPLLLNAFFLPMALAMRWHRDRLAEIRADELARREQWFWTTLSSIGDAVLTTDASETVTFMNPVAEDLTGFRSAEAVGLKVTEVFPLVSERTGEPVESHVRGILEGRTVVGIDRMLLVSRDGSQRPIADSGAPIVAPDGTLQGAVLVFRDMTEERALRAQVEHSQRLDALGTLAGAVAHDFNNLLTVIGGGAELAFEDLPEGHAARVSISEVIDATRRAVGVTRQLLAFSRRQVMRLEPVELNAAVRGGVRLFQRLLRTDVKVVTELGDDAGFVLVDPVQLEQVLLNLAVNANDAMPRGGTLLLSTTSVSIEQAQVEPPLAAGKYGRLQVIDTGVGMDSVTLQRVFEPFFTTKDRGRGTGLGLATVYGIVEQSKGSIRVRSSRGKGTVFEVLLPSCPPAAAARATVTASPPADAAPTVLLVEDDELVRRVALRVLVQEGYNVLEAGSASEALKVIERISGAMDLMVTDVVMPGASGVELAASVRERFPDMPVLFMSGYATAVLAKEGLSGAGGSFVAKPFTPESLRTAVREALAQARR